MKINSFIPHRRLHIHAARFNFRLSRATQVFVLLLTLAGSTAFAQQGTSAKQRKLPSPDKIVSDYLKAIGGKKRVAAVKDATYEWKLEEQCLLTLRLGTATTQIKTPASTRGEMNYRDERVVDDADTTTSASSAKSKLLSVGANARSAWTRDAVDGLHTLTDAQAQAAKLQSMLDASHLIDLKKSKILARTTGIEESSGEPAYVVEFSLRNGARLSYSFSVSSKLLIASQDKAQNKNRSYADYREVNGLLEPHKVRWFSERDGVLTLELQEVRYNTGLADSLFDPPAAESIDVATLLKEIDRNQEQIDERVGDYTYTEKLTERKINDRGEVTEEKVKLFEVYPIPGGNDVHKLISENGVLLSPDKAAKEDKRVAEEMEKAQRERTKEAEKRERDKLKGKKEKSADDDPGIADFLRSTELVSPRRERLRDRETIVFDFRPRAGYKPKGDIESIVSKLTGVMWVDPVDKQVMRLEARLIESYNVGGGLLASVRPGTALVLEQKRMEDGVWLPVFSQVNISAKILLFKGININVVQEFSNYQRFKSDIDDYKLTTPEVKPTSSPSP